MSKVYLLFHHNADDFISQVISWFTHAEASHVALLHPDGNKVIEASAWGKPKGGTNRARRKLGGSASRLLDAHHRRFRSA